MWKHWFELLLKCKSGQEIITPTSRWICTFNVLSMILKQFQWVQAAFCVQQNLNARHQLLNYFSSNPSSTPTYTIFSSSPFVPPLPPPPPIPLQLTQRCSDNDFGNPQPQVVQTQLFWERLNAGVGLVKLDCTERWKVKESESEMRWGGGGLIHRRVIVASSVVAEVRENAHPLDLHRCDAHTTVQQDLWPHSWNPFSPSMSARLHMEMDPGLTWYDLWISMSLQLFPTYFF